MTAPEESEPSPTPIAWPSKEAMQAYAWWELYGDGPWSLRALQRETALLLAAEVEKMLRGRPEWVTARQNDLQMFHEEFSGLLNLHQDGENTGVRES